MVTFAAQPPLVLHVPRAVPHVERLHRLGEPGMLLHEIWNAPSVTGDDRPVRVRQVPVGVGVEVGQRVVLLGALRAAVQEDVVGVVLLDIAANGQRVLARELREVVLDLERVVAQLVLEGERLEAERRVAGAAFEDVDEREQSLRASPGFRPASCSRPGTSSPCCCRSPCSTRRCPNGCSRAAGSSSSGRSGIRCCSAPGRAAPTSSSTGRRR